MIRAHQKGVRGSVIECRLSTILGAKRIKMAEVARGAGLAKGTVAGLYYDRTRMVDYRVLDKLCAYLGVGVGDLLVYVPGKEG